VRRNHAGPWPDGVSGSGAADASARGGEETSHGGQDVGSAEDSLGRTRPAGYLASQQHDRDTAAASEKYGDRRFLTEEELAAAKKAGEARNKRFESGAIPQADSGSDVMNLTSMISEPANGRFPALTPKGKEMYAAMHGSYKPGQTVFDSPDDFDSWDRCITRGMPVSMEPRNYNNGIRIMQTPGYVLIVLEMAHEVRIIPTTPRPPLDPDIKEWMGESRGHWEGNTLVVETTNFNGKTDLTNSGVPGSPPLTLLRKASTSLSASRASIPIRSTLKCGSRIRWSLPSRSR